MNLNDVCNLESPIVKNVVLGNLANVLKKLNKRKVSFNYETQGNTPKNPSRDVEVIGEYTQVSGTIHPECIEKCANGNYILRLKNANRRKISPLGYGDQPKLKRNAMLWRSYRLEGIDLKSIQFKRNGVWKNLFTDC